MVNLCVQLLPPPLHGVQVQDVSYWLRGICRAAINEAASGSSEGGLGAADLAAVVREVYPPSEVNAYAHLRVPEFSDTIAALPAEVRIAPGSRLQGFEVPGMTFIY